MDKLKWTTVIHISTDDDGGALEGTPVALRAYRSGPYKIIQQRSEGGLFILRTPDGLGQFASHDLAEVKAAAEKHMVGWYDPTRATPTVQEADAPLDPRPILRAADSLIDTISLHKACGDDLAALISRVEALWDDTPEAALRAIAEGDG